MSAQRTEQVLPSGITRTEAKKRVARAFDRAVRAQDASNADVGMSIGVSEKRVRRLRSDDQRDLSVVPTMVDVLLADPDLAWRFLVELAAERETLHGATARQQIERVLGKSLVATSQYTTEAAMVLADGKVESTELPGLAARRADAVKSLEDVDTAIALFRTANAKDVIR